MQCLKVSPWDCTGCELCVRICPADALTLGPAEKVIQEEEANWNFAVTLPDRGDEIDKTTVKGSQFQKPYLEFSGACEGCGETPHVKLMTQLFGDRLVIANATGWNVKVRIFDPIVKSVYFSLTLLWNFNFFLDCRFKCSTSSGSVFSMFSLIRLSARRSCRLLLHLGWLQSVLPLHDQHQGRGPCLGQLALRRQCRVRLRHAQGH